MKPLIFVTFVILLFFSCSKEEEIPFKAAVEDTIDLIFYHNIAGTYKGQLQDIEWISDTSYLVVGQRSHTLNIKEIDYSFVELDDISNLTEGAIQAQMFRVNDVGGYLRFVGPTMPDSTGIDSIYFSSLHLEKMNGIYYYSGRLQYFFYSIKNKDTTHQMFDYTAKP